MLAELAGSHEGVESVEPRRLSLAVRGVQYQFILNGSSAAEDLASRCPLDIVLENFADNEKIFYLDEPLDTGDTPLATGAAGTLCYFEPWNDVVITMPMASRTSARVASAISLARRLPSASTSLM